MISSGSGALVYEQGTPQRVPHCVTLLESRFQRLLAGKLNVHAVLGMSILFAPLTAKGLQGACSVRTPLLT